MEASLEDLAEAGHWQRSTRGTLESYSFRLDNVCRLKTPIPVKGRARFWRLDLGIEKQIRDDLGEPMPSVRS